MRRPFQLFLSMLSVFASFVFVAPFVVAVQEDEVVASWDFGSEEATALQPHGGVHRDQPGPRPPEFPDFDAQNTAVLFDGKGSRFSFDDPGKASPFDFTNGDEITLEAWVKVDELRSGENLYVIGKGRTGSKEFSPNNQNWALRVREVSGQARVNFLFATKPQEQPTIKDKHWHRWTATKGFEPGSGWHHIAITYAFGNPESMRGWMDGTSVNGKWDMGGTTAEPPVVDDDEVWIGSSQNGLATSSFRGSMDAIRIHRKLADDALIKGRFRRDDEAAKKIGLAIESMPELGELPEGRVLFTFHESMPTYDRWLKEEETWPEEVDRWLSDSFLTTRLPLHFDQWGMRDAWKTPVLFRIAADVMLEPGERQFLVRARGLSRLWVDGQLIARTNPLPSTPRDNEPITPVPDPPRPGLRRPSYQQQEVFGQATIPATGKCRVVLECIVGRKKFRPEPGELCVAVSTIDSKSFLLLQPFVRNSSALELTDSNIEPKLRELDALLTAKDDEQRRTAAASQNAFWNERHDRARRSVEAKHDGSHTIDAFIFNKIQKMLGEASSTNAKDAKLFREQILPILSEHCFRCHGEKDNGGLKLNSREAFLKGGDSESPAFVPGDADASEALARVRSSDEDARMPPTGEPLTSKQIKVLEAWVQRGAVWAGPQISKEDVAIAPAIEDAAFLRRISLDTIGVPPNEAELREFLTDSETNKRSLAIDRLLRDERWADHWVSYWQDVLAENPTLVNASLNSTGPFRWFLLDALRDNKPMDRWVSELIMMRGGPREGGSAGFGLAGDNDAPLASKGQILASAFLGVELQCARCHDSPYHSTKQKDLYSLAAMLDRKEMAVPKTSMVPAAFFEKQTRESLIKATLKPNESVAAEWPFAETAGTCDEATMAALLQDPKDLREKLAAFITGSQNTRFPKVAANRVWRRLMGAGIVEPPQDWEGKQPSHPELLDWLAEEFIAHDYDVKHLMRLILNSEAYQRTAEGYNLAADPEVRFFNAPDRRRMTAEQVVDSLYVASGASIDVEELTFDPDARHFIDGKLTLGIAKRAWMLGSLNNERDRPSLTFPRVQAIDDVLTAFGWSGSRQMPRTDRETFPTVLQPGILENGTLSIWLTSASYRSELARLALEAKSPETLLDSIFLRFLSRFPTSAEKKTFLTAIAVGFEDRIVPEEKTQPMETLPPLPTVTWSNHLVSEATTIQNEAERRARNGQPPDPRLEHEWREHFEDIVWSLVNHREFVWIP